MNASGVKVMTLGDGAYLLTGHLAEFAAWGDEGHQLVSLIKVSVTKDAVLRYALGKGFFVITVFAGAKKPTVRERYDEKSNSDEDDNTRRNTNTKSPTLRLVAIARKAVGEEDKHYENTVLKKRLQGIKVDELTEALARFHTPL